MASHASALPKDADRAVRNALSDLLAYAAFELEVAEGSDDTVPPDTFAAWIDPEVLAAIGGPVLVLDLHGQRAAAARGRMKSVHEPLAFVFFGKGSGVLRDVFFEVFAATDDYLLAGLSGDTEERPQPSVGLLVRADTYKKLMTALGKRTKGEAGKGKDETAVEPPAKKPRAKKAKAPTVDEAAPIALPASPGARVVLVVLAAALAFVFPPVLVVYVVAAVWYFEGRRKK